LVANGDATAIIVRIMKQPTAKNGHNNHSFKLLHRNSSQLFITGAVEFRLLFGKDYATRVLGIRHSFGIGGDIL
jgi:hypothetical protein